MHEYYQHTNLAQTGKYCFSKVSEVISTYHPFPGCPLMKKVHFAYIWEVGNAFPLLRVHSAYDYHKGSKNS